MLILVVMVLSLLVELLALVAFINCIFLHSRVIILTSCDVVG